MAKKKAKREVEVSEVLLDDKKIDELIEKLKHLKEEKEHEHFDDKRKNELVLAHEESNIL